MPTAPDTIRFASAISDEDETGDALDEALSEAHEQLGGGDVDLAVAFVSYHHRGGVGRLAKRVERELGARVAIGLTAAGVLGSGYELEDQPGVAVLLGRLGGGVWLHPFTSHAADWPATSEGPAAFRRAMLGADDRLDDTAAVLLFADPFSTPMVKLMPAINEAMPGVPIIGGMASGGANAGDNRLMLGGSVRGDGIVGVAIGGAIRADCTVSQGCRPIGEPWIITQARHNIIQHVGRQPIMRAIRDTALAAPPGDRALLEEQGLFVGRVINEYQPRFGRGDFLIRNIIGADQASGYIAVSDLVRVGQTIQFHVRDAATAEEDLRLLLESQKLHGPASGALLCTCNGRGSGLFGTGSVESDIIGEQLGQPPIAGFFAAGEIGPIGEQNFLHGLTASLVVFRPAQEHI